MTTNNSFFPAQADILITDGHVLCMDEGYLSYEVGAVTLSDGIITAVGDAKNAKNVQATETIDAKGMLIVPGLINTHCHAGMTLFRGLADDKNLDDFLKTVWAAEADHVNVDTVYAGAAVGIAEMVAGGITHFVDMYSLPPATLKAARKIGISMTSGPAFVGFHRPSSPTWSFKIDSAHSFIEAEKDSADVQIMIMPHSAYTLDEPQLRELVKLSEQYGLHMHTHGAEAPSEMSQVAAMHNNDRPINVLEKTGLLARNGLIAHGVHLNNQEIDVMAKSGASISHCPLSNAKLASGTARIDDLRSAGVNISLGTDGPSSGNDLDLWKAMRHASYLNTLTTGDPESLPARELFAMATRNGAKALGLEDEIGTLEVGKRADIAIIDMTSLHLTPSYDPYSSLAYSVGRDDVCHVIARGKIVVKNRWVLNDLNSEMACVQDIANQIMKSSKTA